MHRTRCNARRQEATAPAKRRKSLPSTGAKFSKHPLFPTPSTQPTRMLWVRDPRWLSGSYNKHRGQVSVLQCDPATNSANLVVRPPYVRLYEQAEPIWAALILAGHFMGHDGKD